MILISEIFGPTIQGEGAAIGVPTVFVRTAVVTSVATGATRCMRWIAPTVPNGRK